MITKEEYEKFMKGRYHVACCLNVTNQCNLRCTYCFTEHNPRNMSLQTAKDAIMYLCKQMDNADNKRGLTVNFFGGEPMLRFEEVIKPLVEWAEDLGLTSPKAYNIRFGMTTNGTLLNEERIKWIKEHNLGMLLSIDGDKETQDSNRPCLNKDQSSFELIEKNLPLLLEHYPNLTFRSTVTPASAGKLFENYIFARNYGFNSYFVIPNVYEKWEKQDIVTLLSEMGNICWTIYKDIQNNQSPLNFSEVAYALQNAIGPEKEAPGIYETISRCGIGTNSIGIGTDGTIWGCQEHSTLTEDIFTIGNIYDGIDPDKHLRLLQEYTKEDHCYCKENPDRCKTCAYYRLCPYHTCPSQLLHNSWTFEGQPEIYCIWKDFIHKMGALMVERACIEGNENLFQYIIDSIGMTWEGGKI